MLNYSTISGFEINRAYNFYTNGFQDSINQLYSRCLAPLCRCFKGDVTNRLSSSYFDDNNNNINIAMSEDEFVGQNVGSYVQKEPAVRTPFEDFVTYDMENELLGEKNFLLLNESQTKVLNYVFLSLSNLFCLLTITTLAIIIKKMYSKSVKGNQSLGIILLIGILMLFMTSFAFLTKLSEIVKNFFFF